MCILTGIFVARKHNATFGLTIHPNCVNQQSFESACFLFLHHCSIGNEMTYVFMYISCKCTFQTQHVPRAERMGGVVLRIILFGIWQSCFGSLVAIQRRINRSSIIFFFLSLGIYTCIHPITKKCECLSNNYLLLCISSLGKLLLHS